jgi:cysteine desulfurase family protein (TIGR01976 family)
MTTLTFALSRSLAKTWGPRDEVLVTRLDHDANVTPWVLAARDAGATIRFIELHRDDCTLDLDDLQAKLTTRTRLLAVGCASNVVGTINPVGEICRLAHAVGAQVFLDGVHYAPHALIDVEKWNCDYLACSAYKFFGPHVGLLWGRRTLLETLQVYKVRPATDELPGKWMTGTQNHEGIAGTLAAIEYLADLGRLVAPSAETRRSALNAAYQAIGHHERKLVGALLAGLAQLPTIRILGITDCKRLDSRTPTVAFVHAGFTAADIAERLGREGIFAGHGNFYALQLTETLGLEPAGVVRIGLMHYTTEEEIQRLLTALSKLE